MLVAFGLDIGARDVQLIQGAELSDVLQAVIGDIGVGDGELLKRGDLWQHRQAVVLHGRAE